jgi:hypothetical protein
LQLTAQHVEAVTVNYYLMDLEHLFSTSPFVGQDSRRFAQIRPNRREVIALDGPATARGKTWALPEEFRSRNVLVEVEAAGQRQSQTLFAHRLALTVTEPQGQLQVRSPEGTPLPRTYIKVFAEVNGSPVFYKDGYTDLRGRFDYASLSTDDLGNATRFSLLVLSPTHGALVREAKVPVR